MSEEERGKRKQKLPYAHLELSFNFGYKYVSLQTQRSTVESLHPWRPTLLAKIGMLKLASFLFGRLIFDSFYFILNKNFDDGT